MVWVRINVKTKARVRVGLVLGLGIAICLFLCDVTLKAASALFFSFVLPVLYVYHC